MHIIKSAKALNSYLNTIREGDSKVTIGFIPTMGALHQGHASLIDESVKNNTFTFCSIFVNPTQFGEATDLEKYPRPIERDIKLLVEHGCSVLFLPALEDVYPKNYIHKEFDLNNLDHKIEGESRPGHFQGVSNVISRFFDIIEPTNAYFGQKDFQQTAVVRRLIEKCKYKTALKIVPIKREPHGLAMSSRNVRLSDKGRKNAAFIYKSLYQLREDTPKLGLKESVSKAKQFINAQKGARVDYLVAVNSKTLEEVDQINDAESIAVLTVVEYEGVRLLDNIILK